MHTPEQAASLWCPMSRVAQAGNVDIPVAYNRSLNKQHKPMRSVRAEAEDFKLGEAPEEATVLVLTATPGVSMAANCLADKCAMWRWNEAIALETEYRTAPVAPPWVKADTGFCGLAGRPEVF
jgi:hypothetical protein